MFLKQWTPLRRGIVAAGVFSTLLGLTACSTSSSSPSAPASVTAADEFGTASHPISLTMWSWGGGKTAPIVDAYEKLHPHVKVNITEFGGSADVYTKLSVALKAGKGAPDLTSMELMNMPSYAAQGYFVDLAKYGAKVQNFDASATAAASFDGHLYAIPTDTGPLVMYYDKKVFDKLGLSAPTTWSEYEADAKRLKAAGHYAATTDPGDPSLIMGLLQQAGAHPFTLKNKSDLSVQFSDAGSKEVESYWSNMLKQGYLLATPAWSQDWFNKLANGTYATWLTGAWGGSVLSGSIPKAAGDWRVAALPNWTSGTASDGVWGGSSTAVTVQTKHPAAATAFASWYATNVYLSQLDNAANVPFPASKTVLDDPRYQSAVSTFLGGQKPNPLYIQASKTVNSNWQFLPFQLYANTIYKDSVGQHLTGDEDLAAGLNAWAAQIVAYAKQNGFTVSQ